VRGTRINDFLTIVENYNTAGARDDRTSRVAPVIWQFIRDDKKTSRDPTLGGNYRRTLRTAKVMPVIMPDTREPVTARPADGTALAMELALAVFQPSPSRYVFARNPPLGWLFKPAITISMPLSDGHGSETLAFRNFLRY